MSETTESRLRGILLGYFSMFIATLSLVTSIDNGYLNSRFVDASATPNWRSIWRNWPATLRVFRAAPRI